MSFLEKAIQIAVRAHTGQVDKAGKPYILHPLRVMLKCATEEQMIVAVLHDVIEDTPVHRADLQKEGFRKEILDALDCVTKINDDEDYDAFIDRIIPNSIARAVKLRDLEDNMDISRLPDPQEKDFKRLKKYIKTHRRLSDIEKKAQERYVNAIC